MGPARRDPHVPQARAVRHRVRRAADAELEGIVSKVADSPYLGGRGDYWVKTTCAHRETLAIAGYKIKDDRFDGIFVGRRNGGELLYAGKVEHGFEDSMAMLKARSIFE